MVVGALCHASAFGRTANYAQSTMGKHLYTMPLHAHESLSGAVELISRCVSHALSPFALVLIEDST